MKKLWQARQGDVFVIESESIPSSAKKQKGEQGRHILEHGEVTGHAHAIPAVKENTMFLDGVRKYLELCLAAPLTHEEHSRIEIPAGNYEVRRQCTWSVLEQMSRVVAD